MRRYTIIFAVLVLLGLVGATAMAAEVSSTATITVDYIDLLEVAPAAALTLTATTPGATTYTQGTLSQTDGLKYSHKQEDHCRCSEGSWQSDQ